MTNRYTDLHHLNKIQPRPIPGRKPINGHKSSPKKTWLKSFFLIFSLAIVIYGTKLLLTPVGHVLGAFLSTSATTISLTLSGKELKNDNGVTNFLIVGLDRRSNIPYSYQGPNGVEERNGFNTDTIIVASFNKNTGSASLLSIPRDLWITIPGFKTVQTQQGRINSVMAIGDQFAYPGGGMALLAKVLGQDESGKPGILNIPIHYWLRVDFDGFAKVIDAVGGVDVLVENPFTDYLYPIPGMENSDCGAADPEFLCRFEKISFKTGLQHMNGETALAFARSRHSLSSEGSDFARAKRQQKVIMAVKDKVLSADTLFDLSKIKNLYNILSDSKNVLSSVETSDLPLFYLLAKKFSLIEAQSYVLDDSTPESLLYHPSQDLFGGAWVLLPKEELNKFDKIKAFVQQIFYNSLPLPTSISPIPSKN